MRVDLSPEERWEQAQEWMEAALEQEPERRRAFLEEECGDEDLRLEVLSLLGYAGSTTTFMDEPAVRLAVPSPSEPEEVPERIDPYRLVRPLGRGGMGSVHLAVRSDGVYRKPVALKLLRPALVGEETIRRFRREREILAHLEHPNIARLLDGGTVGERPFLVMEYVEGRPIDRFCAENQLGLRDRLRLFRTVCEAIRFAHQNLIVHRDIKPSNILVTPDGVPKILDFGIAKLLSGEDFSQTVLATVPGRAPMTPAYASPEQIRGGTITTATDVYSLGVLLFELLTGRRPYKVAGASPGEMERIVCETPTPRPSTEVLAKTEDSDEGLETDPTIQALSSRDRWRLRRRLRGDLDNIVLMALRKEPQRRYSSAEQLGLDVENYLRGLPVIAHRDSLTYRLSKFVRRHRAAVLASVLGLFMALGFFTLQLRSQQELLEQSLEAQFTSSVLVQLFTNADPWSNTGETLSVRELLERGAEEVRSRETDPPEVRSELMSVLGRSFLNLGDFDAARGLLDESLEIRRSIYPSDPSKLLGSLHLSAQLAMDSGRYEEAETLARESLEVGRRLDRGSHKGQVEALFRLARVLDLRGSRREARDYYRRAEEMARELDQPELLATVLDRYGLLLAGLASYDEGERILQEALQIFEEELGQNHPKVAFTLVNLARLLRDLERYPEAEALLRRAEEIQRQAFGDRHPHLASTLGILGAVLHESGRSKAGEALLTEAVAIRKAVYRENEGPQLAATLAALALVHHDQGRYGEAEAEAREALTISRGFLDEGHPETASALDVLGLVTLALGDLESAHGAFDEALGIYRQVFGEHHPRTGLALRNLAMVAYSQKDYPEAVGLYREAATSLEEGLGAEHIQTLLVYNDLGLASRKAGDLEAAEAAYGRALELGRETLPETDERIGLVLNNLGRLASEQGDPVQAEVWMRQALENFRLSLAPDHPWQRVARRVLARVLAEQGRFEEAETILRQQYDGLLNTSGLDSAETQKVLRQMHRLYDAWERDPGSLPPAQPVDS